MTDAVGLDSLPVPVATVGGSGRVVDASATFESLLGAGPGGLRDRELAAFLAPDDRQLLRASLSGPGDEIRVAARRLDGLPVVAVLLIGGPVGSSARCIVAVRGGPKVVRGSDEASSSAGRGEIDGALSHDVRGSLRGIGGFLSLLDRERDVLSAEAAEFLDTAKRSTDTADQMAARLVELIRLEERTLAVDPVDLGSVVDEATEAVSVEVVRGRLPMVMANRALMVQVVGELLGNAEKFGATRVEIDSHVEEGWVQVGVGDDGPGVPPDLRDSALDLFRMLQAKGVYPGVGAGLAVCARIAAIHGGRLRLAEVRSGTRVELRLLAADRRPPDGPGAPVR